MPAVFVNCGSVILGSIIGLLFSKKFTEELSKMIQTACGIVTLVLGIQMAFKYQSVVFLTLSLIVGGILGYLLNIDGAILRCGAFLEKIIYKKHPGNENADLSENKGKENFAYAFLNASILFCVGAMAIIGSFKAGVEKDYSIIYTKSILDGFMAISFTASMGIGTAFSTITILLYQGALTLLSIKIQPYVTEELLNELTACGGTMIIMIGLNLMSVIKVKTANFLPALVIMILFVAGKSFFM